MNYGELRDQIRNYTEVDSNGLTDTTVAQITKNTENRIYREIQIDGFRAYATSAMTTGNRYVTVPTNLRNIRYVQITDTDGNQNFLQQKDTSFMAEFDPTPSTSFGTPKYYANWDENTWVVAPTPDDDYNITLAYYVQPTSITTSPTSTSYVSTFAEDLLLYGCLSEAYKYLKGPDNMIQLYEQSYQTAKESFGVEQTGRRRRDEYVDGVVRVPLQSVDPSK
jgi:hypothetical protein